MSLCVSRGSPCGDHLLTAQCGVPEAPAAAADELIFPGGGTTLSGLTAGRLLKKGSVVKHSEFWGAVEAVFGSAYGRSLAQDLVLPELDATCVQALDRGVAPERVWALLCEETERSDAERWIFRSDPRR